MWMCTEKKISCPNDFHYPWPWGRKPPEVKGTEWQLFSWAFHKSYTLLPSIWLVAMLPIKVYYIKNMYGNLYGKLDAFVKETRLGSCAFQAWKVPDTDTGLSAFCEKQRMALSWAPINAAKKGARCLLERNEEVLQGKCCPRFTKPVWLQVTLLLDKKKPVSNVF